jgi:hypothetical protein
VAAEAPRRRGSRRNLVLLLLTLRSSPRFAECQTLGIRRRPRLSLDTRHGPGRWRGCRRKESPGRGIRTAFISLTVSAYWAGFLCAPEGKKRLVIVAASTVAVVAIVVAIVAVLLSWALPTWPQGQVLSRHARA